MLRTSPADTDEGMARAVAWLRPRRACVLWGRWKSAPAVTVRDPTTASGRLTRWNSWTDGHSPDEKCTLTARTPSLAPAGECPVARPPESHRTGGGDDDQRGRAARHAARAAARHDARRPPRPQPPRRVRAARRGRHHGG